MYGIISRASKNQISKGSTTLKMNERKKNEKKVISKRVCVDEYHDEGDMKQESIFGVLPDEMVLSILSYGTIKDIENTRVWQTEKVKECTTTTSMIKAAKNDNLDTMKWIYIYIEKKIYIDREDPDEDCTGKKIRI